MSNKDMLIVALENAENNGKEVEFCYLSNDGFRFSIWMIPEVLQNENEIQIYDAESGMDHSLSILVFNDVTYNEEKNEYCILTKCGICTVCFAK